MKDDGVHISNRMVMAIVLACIMQIFIWKLFPANVEFITSCEWNCLRRRHSPHSPHDAFNILMILLPMMQQKSFPPQLSYSFCLHAARYQLNGIR